MIKYSHHNMIFIIYVILDHLFQIIKKTHNELIYITNLFKYKSVNS